MASIAVNPEGHNNRLGITNGMLAGRDFNGLPSYTVQLKQLNSAKELTIKRETTECTVHAIVLALLAIVAAAGCATIIAFSGVPAQIDLKLFVPGVLLGATSLGLTIWLIVVITRAIRHSKAQEKEVTDWANIQLDNEKILAELQKEDVNQENIFRAMNNFTDQQRSEFILWTHDKYFLESSEPLSNEKKKVLEACARSPAALQTIFNNPQNANRMHSEFALQVLTYIDPNQVETIEGKELLVKLFGRLNTPVTSHFDVLARHPTALAFLAQNEPDKYSVELEAYNRKTTPVSEAYELMTIQQKAAFLKQMADDYEALQATLSRNLAAEQLIRNIVWPCIRSSFTPEFATAFVPKQGSNQEEVSRIEEAGILLKQIARYPIEAAHRLYIVSTPTIVETGLINALYAAMSDTNKQVFVDYAALELNKKPESKFYHAQLINSYAQANEPLPEATLKIFAKTPAAMGYAIPHFNSANSEAMGEQIITSMALDLQVNFLSSLKCYYKEFFMKKMTSLLEGPEPLTENSQVIAYLKKHPEDFNILVIGNTALGDDQKRGTLSLEVLEKMGVAAQRAINDLDKTLGFNVTYKNFIYLTNLLIDQVKQSPNNISGGRRELIARFYQASQMREAEKSRTTFALAGIRFGIELTQDQEARKAFETIAKTQIDVWNKDKNPI